MNSVPTMVQCMSCPDQPGIVLQVCQAIADFDANIIHLEQHVDHDDDLFFMRLLWQPKNLVTHNEVTKRFQSMVNQLNMTITSHDLTQPRRMAILVSKQSHCLYDLLARYQSHQWNVVIPIIISNHIDCAQICERFNVPFIHLPIEDKNKAAQEQQMIKILAEHQVDTIVLARYMQILSAEFVAQFPNQIINIHHSFLPAFIGAKPYHQAHARGVKMIGATSHYVTADLDQGPIISQDTAVISHRKDTAALIRMGQDIEKLVLNEAITAHLNHKVLIHNKKTIVFE